MQTRSLNTLATISRVESFATAAEQLGATLSTVSMQMKALEIELNAQLFDRTFRPPKLTPLGRRIAELAEELIRLQTKLVKSCQSSNKLIGRFRLGFIPTAKTSGSVITARP